MKSGTAKIPLLPYTSERVLTFTLYVPLNATGNHTLNLHVKYDRVSFISVVGNTSSTYEVQYFYKTVKKTIPIKVNITQTVSPRLKVIPATTVLYGDEINKLRIQIENEGNYAVKNVKFLIYGNFELLNPKTAYVSYIPASGSVPVIFTVKARKGLHTVETEVVYQYFNGIKWINTSEKSEFKITFKQTGCGIEVSLSKTEFERDQTGIIHLFVMNNYIDPVSVTVRLKDPKGMDFDPDTVLVGRLAPGEVRSFPLTYQVDENAKSGNKTVLVSVHAKFLNYPDFDNFSVGIPLTIKSEPDFTASCNRTLYVGEDNQILTVNLTNNGEFARDIHATLIPSPGIIVKDPEAYIEHLGKGQTKKLMFKIDVDKDLILGKVYRLEIKLTSKDTKGEKYNENVYIYIKISKKSEVMYYILAGLLALAAAILLKTWKKLK